MPRRNPLHFHLLALIASWGVAIVVTWPAAIMPTRGLIGHPGNDIWNHLWGFWWFLEGVVKDGGIPTHTELLNHPEGGTLWFIDAFNGVLSIPLQLIFGLPLTWNIMVTGAIAWSIFGGFTLAHHVLRDVFPAAVAGVIFGVSPHILGQAYNGIDETINTGWLALYVYTLLRVMERPRPRRGLVLGLMLGLCALSNFYYGLFGILITAVVVFHQALTDPWRIRWKQFFGSSALGAALFSVMVLPVLRTLSRTMDAADAVVNRDPEFVWESLLRHNMTDLVCFFRPGKFYSPDLKALYGEELIIVVYLGWVALLLALAGAALSRRRRELSLWMWIFVIFWIFSLGPYLYLDGEYLQVNGRMIPLPFLPFFKAFPLFSRISHPFRFVVPATLGLSILSGYGVRMLLRGVPRIGRVVGAGLLAALVMGEVLLASPAHWPMPMSDANIPSAYQDMPVQGAVLDVPITVPNLERAVYLYYQTAHARPGPYGLNDPLPSPLKGNRLTRFLVEIESGYAQHLPRLLPELELVAGGMLLRDQGYSYIVVHDKLYPAHKRRMVETVLTAAVGPPRKYPDDGISLYKLK